MFHGTQLPGSASNWGALVLQTVPVDTWEEEDSVFTLRGERLFALIKTALVMSALTGNLGSEKRQHNMTASFLPLYVSQILFRRSFFLFLAL